MVEERRSGALELALIMLSIALFCNCSFYFHSNKEQGCFNAS